MRMLSARFEENTILAIDQIAKNMDLTRSDVMNKAVEMYIDYITWFKDEVQKGIDDVKAGRVVPHEEVLAQFDKFLEDL